MYRVLFVLINVSSNVGSDAGCRFAECRFAERRYAENRYANCRGAEKCVFYLLFFIAVSSFIAFFPR